MAVAAADKITEPRRRSLELVCATRLETTLVAVGVLTIAVHIVDDSFLQPQPGTSGADHLVGGLVPLALLAAAIAVYPRLRAGGRATVALVVGALGAVIGATEPVYYASHGGLSGDDYTGLPAAAAGIGLIGLGAVLLWRSRDGDGPLPRRYGRRLLRGLAAALFAFFVLFPFALSYGFTHAARPATPSGNLGAPYKTVSFDASDDVRLDGWLVPSRNRAAVIVFPGKKGTQRHARMLVRHGYGVLVFDRRGEGTSEGDPNTFGWAFDRDLKGAIRFLRRQAGIDPARIGGLGLSVGGEALLQTAAETRELKAVVSEGAGARSVREDVIGMRAAKVPEVVMSSFITLGTALFGNQLPPPSLESLAGRIRSTPVFFIYAAHGQGGEEKNPAYYAAAAGPKQLWKIDTTHTDGIQARPAEYERRVVRFFDRTLLGAR